MQRLLIVLLSLALAAAGVWAYEALPMDAYPDLSPPYVEIIAQWPGHSAEEVERLITVPVERGMNAIPGLTIKRSISLYGLSDVTLTFADGTTSYFARQQVYNLLPGITLPNRVNIRARNNPKRTCPGRAITCAMKRRSRRSPIGRR